MTRVPLFLAAVVVATGACDRPEATNAIPDIPASAEWTLEEIYNVRGPKAGERFLDVRSLALHPDGRLVVVDNGQRLLSLFEAHGGYGAPVGGFGAAPTEYKDPYSAVWLTDTLAIYDPEMQRVLFLRDARTLVGHAAALKLVGAVTVRFYPVSESKAFLRSMIPHADRFRPAFVGFGSRFPADTIAIADPEPLPNGSICRHPNGTPFWFDWPETPVDFVVPVRADGAAATARTTEYRIVIRGATGDTIVVLRRPYDRVPYPEAEWTEAIKPYTEWVERYGQASCEARPTRPTHRAPVRAMTVSADGEVWVTVATPTGPAFDVYTLAGERRATIAAPSHLTSVPIAVAGDRVALADRHADGSPMVRMFRIVRPPVQ